MTIVRTTFQAPQLLLYRLKVQAAKEQTDVSRLLCRAAELYLDANEHRDQAIRSEAALARKRAASYGPRPRRGGGSR